MITTTSIRGPSEGSIYNQAFSIGISRIPVVHNLIDFNIDTIFKLTYSRHISSISAKTLPRSTIVHRSFLNHTQIYSSFSYRFSTFKINVSLSRLLFFLHSVCFSAFVSRCQRISFSTSVFSFPRRYQLCFSIYSSV